MESGDKFVVRGNVLWRDGGGHLATQNVEWKDKEGVSEAHTETVAVEPGRMIECMKGSTKWYITMLFVFLAHAGSFSILVW